MKEEEFNKIKNVANFYANVLVKDAEGRIRRARCIINRIHIMGEGDTQARWDARKLQRELKNIVGISNEKEKQRRI